MIAHVISLLAAEDPTQTHSWILPETAEIIYGGLATVIVVSALAKFAGPMIKKSFSARTEKIQKSSTMRQPQRSLQKAMLRIFAKH